METELTQEKPVSPPTVIKRKMAYFSYFDMNFDDWKFEYEYLQLFHITLNHALSIFFLSYQ